MFVDKLKKIKTRVVLRGQVPCTKEVWRYIGVNNVYRSPLDVWKKYEYHSGFS